MPRPKKCRRICALPRCSSFGPWRGGDGPVEMAVEEYEAIRLIDLLGCTQEECAAQMRGGLLHGAAGVRHRPAQAGSGPGGGRRLHISGGDYVLCPRERECPGRDCARRDCGMGRCGAARACGPRKIRGYENENRGYL